MASNPNRSRDLLGAPGTARIYIDRKAAARGEPPVVVARDGVPKVSVAFARILGPSRIIWDQDATVTPAVWIETESFIDIGDMRI